MNFETHDGSVNVAIIASKDIVEIKNLEEFVPNQTTKIVSSTLKFDDSFKKYLAKNNVKFIEVLPDYKKYGTKALLKLNLKIIRNCDLVLVFWNGKSTDTKSIIDSCNELEIPIKVFLKKSWCWTEISE